MNSITVVLFFAFVSSVLTEDGPIVEIKNGKILGRNDITKLNQVPYEAFKGIPFAKPPLGDLRFEPPQPVEDWDDILNATEDTHKCLQYLGVFDENFKEDCLYVNVYTPSSTSKNLPVMVWIYGGGFFFGDLSYSHFPPDYFLENDIVFVTLNYRVGIFGFYSTEDEIAPGNAGLKDQIAALKWVNKNIENFGGNPENVTIFGQSAGSASVSYLILSNQTKGLFQRAILHSGTSINQWALAMDKKRAAFETGKLLGIETNDSSILIEELRTRGGYELVYASLLAEAGTMAFTNPLDGLMFGPSVEPDLPGAVITEASYDKLLKGDFNQVPTIIGYNSNEGVFFYPALSLIKLYMLTYALNNTRLVPADMNVNDPEIAEKLGKQIVEKYNISNTLNASNVDITKFLSHGLFLKGIYKAVELHSKFAPVYFYRFDYLGGETNHYDDVSGIGHNQELQYIFCQDLPTTDRDKTTRDRMVKLWTNFAKSSNPTPNEDEVFQNVIWPEFEMENQYYLNIQDDLSVGSKPDEDAVNFWNNLYDTYGQPPFNTY